MRQFSTTLCKFADALFIAPPLKWIIKTPALGERMHPGAYVEWEFQNAPSSWHYFRPYDQLKGKLVLDVGCAHGGKSTYYAVQGARHVLAIDKDKSRIEDARDFAMRKGVYNIEFEYRDAAMLTYPPECFDLVIYNDSFEHIEEPAKSLNAAYLVLKKGGTVNIAFPPYGSPWGAHLFAYIRIPWAQFFFPEVTLINLWKTRSQAEATEKIAYSSERILSMSTAQTIEELAQLNMMSIRKFMEIMAQTPFRVLSFNVRTVGNLFPFVAHLRQIREYLVTRLVVVLGKNPK